MFKKYSLGTITVFTMFLASALFIMSCTQSGDEAATPGDETTQENAVGEKEVVIKVEDNSPVIEGASVMITSPGQESTVESGKEISVKLDTSNFETGVQTETPRSGEIANSGDGQHVHLIVDNQPYMAIYDVSEPVNIGTLEPGPHTVFAFPSRSYHESVKSEGASDMVNFYVGESGGEFELTEDTPAVVYSRPKGEYKGEDAKKIMLDFYLNNVKLGPDGYKVRYVITSKADPSKSYSVTLEEWKPAFIYNLPSGDYTVSLELLDKDGNVAPGKYNSTERDIKVVAE